MTFCRHRVSLLFRLSVLLFCGVATGAQAQTLSSFQPSSGSAVAPLVLDEALHVALSQNPAVLSAKQTRLSMEAKQGVARSAWLPQVGLSGSARGDFSYPLGKDNAVSFRSSGSLSVNQLLYDFGRVSNRMSAAHAAAQAAQTDEMYCRAQVVLATTSGFFAVLQAEALLAVASENVEQQNRRLKQAESFFKIGTKPQIDVLIAQTAVAQARLQVIQAVGNVQVARTQFLQSLGLPESEWAAWQKRPFSPELPAPHGLEGSSPQTQLDVAPLPEEVVEQVLRGRPDYQALLFREKQAEYVLSATRADYGPSLSAGASATMNSGTYGGVTGLDVTMQAVPGLLLSGTLSVSWPLFTGLSTVYAVRDARAQLQVAQANLLQMRLNVRSQLAQALQQVRTARLSVDATAAVWTQAKKQFDMADGRYRAGVGNAIELGDAQLAALQAQAQFVQAQFALASQRANLRFALGELTPKDTQTPSRANRPEPL